MDKQQRILVVDDHETNREILASLLTFLNYSVLEAVDGEDGVRQAVQHRPELVLMDLSMPEMDGWEAVRRIRETPEVADVPVIALTAHEVDEGEWRSGGFTAYMRKPCPALQLLDTIREFVPLRSTPG